MSTKTFPCTACGAKLEFAPGKSALQCPYCGSENKIPEAEVEEVVAAVEELDYDTFLRNRAGNEPLLEAQAIKCTGCGAASTLPANTTAGNCPFCNRPVIAANAYVSRQIRPKSLMPFQIEKKQAMQQFKAWIDSLWFAPNALKNAYRADNGMRGIYMPYWTYDSHTETRYTGARGDDYYVTERYTEQVNGDTVTRTREVRKTRWTPVSGNVAVDFDDVLINGSASLPTELADRLQNWNLSALVPYRDDYISGFTVEAYQVGLEPAFAKAQNVMEADIRIAINQDIGGDHQQIATMHPAFYDITFKHILLPIWLSAYRYQGKTYRFLVNGQTGEVQGERPWSIWKILGAILLVLGIIGIAYTVTHRKPNNHSRQSNHYGQSQRETGTGLKVGFHINQTTHAFDHRLDQKQAQTRT